MNEEDKKAVTIWLGEKWHYLESDAEITCACGEKWIVKSIDVEQHENRTFKEPTDFFACFNRLVELGEWEMFEDFISQVYMDELGEFRRYIPWLNSRTDSGHFRLCALVSEALKEGGLK